MSQMLTFIISCYKYITVFLNFIVAPCILTTLMFLSPTNALLYYTYKMLKYTVKISHDCSYMFRSIWTIMITETLFTNITEHLTTYYYYYYYYYVECQIIDNIIFFNCCTVHFDNTYVLITNRFTSVLHI